MQIPGEKDRHAVLRNKTGATCAAIAAVHAGFHTRLSQEAGERATSSHGVDDEEDISKAEPEKRRKLVTRQEQMIDMILGIFQDNTRVRFIAGKVQGRPYLAMQDGSTGNFYDLTNTEDLDDMGSWSSTSRETLFRAPPTTNVWLKSDIDTQSILFEFQVSWDIRTEFSCMVRV